MTTLVWFKRDLRLDDHAPLVEACARGPVLPLYIVEPALWQQPDAAPRHWDFLRGLLFDLDRQLRALGSGLHVYTGPAVEVLEHCRGAVRAEALHSHEETGNHWTYTRDQAVAHWARSRGLAWRQWPQFGVVRGLRDRDEWAGRWQQFMEARAAERPASIPAAAMPAPDPGAALATPRGQGNPAPRGQTASHAQAESIWNSFLDDRARAYRGGISRPERARTRSSRISPYLTFGALSLRRVVQDTWSARRCTDAGDSRRLASLQAFESRLHWHCHFIQKLEDEPELEYRCLHRGFEGMRPEADADEERRRLFDAWREGVTGYPLVDACMRQLHAEGWLNFRMRAMLMSFASYHLWLHWRQPALHLARVFTDYEPGIHYSQVQMQSGTTGINPTRIYNPVLQSERFDPEGDFIRRWVPEVRALPREWVHRPWQAPPSVQRALGPGADYTRAVVDYEDAARRARAAYKEWTSRHSMRAETDRVVQRHASRAPGRGSRRPRKDAAQLDLGL